MTPRIEVRQPLECDRHRFVNLFRDEEFMVFSDGVLTEADAHARFDRMLANAAQLAFAKQPVIERSTGLIVGYAGVDWFVVDGRRVPEFGYRLVPDARGRGYATEASHAVLRKAVGTFVGDVFAIIDPTNHASQNVARKLGFDFVEQAVLGGCLRDLYRLRIA